MDSVCVLAPGETGKASVCHFQLQLQKAALPPRKTHRWWLPKQRTGLQRGRKEGVPTTVTLSLMSSFICDRKGLIPAVVYWAPACTPTLHLFTPVLNTSPHLHTVWREALEAAEQVSCCHQEDAGRARKGKGKRGRAEEGSCAQEGPWLLPSLA